MLVGLLGSALIGAGILSLSPSTATKRSHTAAVAPCPPPAPKRRCEGIQAVAQDPSNDTQGRSCNSLVAHSTLGGASRNPPDTWEGGQAAVEARDTDPRSESIPNRRCTHKLTAMQSRPVEKRMMPKVGDRSRSNVSLGLHLEQRTK